MTPHLTDKADTKTHRGLTLRADAPAVPHKENAFAIYSRVTYASCFYHDGVTVPRTACAARTNLRLWEPWNPRHTSSCNFGLAQDVSKSASGCQPPNATPRMRRGAEL